MENTEVGVSSVSELTEDKPVSTSTPYFWGKWCQHGFTFWCRKYFWEGQITHGNAEGVSDGFLQNMRLTPTQRKWIAILVPLVVFHLCWWAVMIKKDLWYLFVDKYPMTITMFFAAAIAGMTSKGGGAVAFPIMTLVLNVPPNIARDFAIMIQCFGMGSASFGVILMKVQLEVTALISVLIGGIIGVILGIEVIEQHLSAPVKKMGFVCIWFAFTVALFLLNRQKKRKVFRTIPYVNWWKVIILVFGGIIGGIITSFAGSGVDMCCYSLLTLFFRVSEKVATPTSLVLMALISMVGFFWRGLILVDISTIAWEFLLVCIPAAVATAPIGSVIGSHFHRLVLAALVHIIDITALIGAFVIVPQTAALACGSVAVIIIGSLIFLGMTKIGEHVVKSHDK